MKKLLFVQLVISILLVVGGCPQEIEEEKEKWGKKIPSALEGVWFVKDNNLDWNRASVTAFRVFYFKSDGYVYVYSSSSQSLRYSYLFDNGIIYSEVQRVVDLLLNNFLDVSEIQSSRGIEGSFISRLKYNNKNLWVINLDQKFRYEVSDQGRIRFFTEAIAGSNHVYMPGLLDSSIKWFTSRNSLDELGGGDKKIFVNFFNGFNIKNLIVGDSNKFKLKNGLELILGYYYFFSRDDFFLNMKSQNEWMNNIPSKDQFLDYITCGFFEYKDPELLYENNAFYKINKNDKYEHQVIDYKINKNDKLEVKYSVETSLGTVVFNRMKVWEGPDSSDSGWKSDKIELLNRTLDYCPIDVNLGKLVEYKESHNVSDYNFDPTCLSKSMDNILHTLYVKGEPSVLWLYAD